MKVTMEQITAFKSSDGKLFATAKEAEAHELQSVWEERVELFMKNAVCPYPNGIYRTMAKNTIFAWEAFKGGAQQPVFTSKTPIAESGLSYHVLNIFQAEQIEFIEDAQAMNNNELLKLQNLGPKALAEIRQWRKS